MQTTPKRKRQVFVTDGLSITDKFRELLKFEETFPNTGLSLAEITAIANQVNILEAMVRKIESPQSDARLETPSSHLPKICQMIDKAIVAACKDADTTVVEWMMKWLPSGDFDTWVNAPKGKEQI